MSTVRQDSWSSDEDLILAEVVLRHIREGSTQLAAFEEVGERLQRTSAACGFRWNSAIRKKYEAAIALAKKQRKKSKQSKNDVEVQEVEFAKENEPVATSTTTEKIEEHYNDTKERTVPNISLADVIAFLQSYKEKAGKNETLAKQNESLKAEIEDIKAKNKKLEKEIEKITKEKELINEDYRMLINIMERARQMSINTEEDRKEKV